MLHILVHLIHWGDVFISCWFLPFITAGVSLLTDLDCIKCEKKTKKACPLFPSLRLGHFDNEIENEESENNQQVYTKNYYFNATVVPNPSTNGSFMVSANEISRVTVINLLGEIIYQFNPTQKQESNHIDISYQPKGIYFIKVEKEGGFSIHKVIYE